MASKFGSASTVEGQSKFGAATPAEIPEWEREAADPSLGMSAAEAWAVSAGRGMEKMGRGARAIWNYMTGDDEEYNQILAEEEESRRLYKPVEKRFPIASTTGQLTGEVVAGAPIGGPVGLGAQAVGKKVLGSLGTRMLAGGSAGLTEGAIAGASEGQGTTGGLIGGTIGAAAEAVMPPLFNAFRRVFRGLTRPEFDANVRIDADGNPQPSPELAAALERQGVSWEGITEPVLREIRAGDPEEAARLAMFREQGIEPAGPSRITTENNLRDQQVEGYFLRRTDDDAADDLRAKMLQENQQVEARFDQIAGELGIPGEAGEVMKDALLGQKSSLASARRRAYDDLGRLAEDLDFDIPINKQGIIRAGDAVDEYPIDDAIGNKLDQLWVEFGFAPEVEIKQSVRGQVAGREAGKELTVSTLEKFRQRVNKIFTGKEDPAHRAARGEIIKAIDDELDILADLEGTGSKVSQLREQARKARSLRRQEAEVFEAKDLVQRLIGTKPGTATPLIDAAEVVKTLSTTTKRAEYNKVVSMLESGDEASKSALGNLQAAVVMDILAASRKEGFRMGPDRMALISGTQMTKAMNKFGREKLKRLFQTNPEALRHLNQLERINKRRMNEEAAVQKGSLPPALLNNLIGSLTRIVDRPEIPAAVRGTVTSVLPEAGRGQAKKIVRTIKPTRKELEDFMLFNMPMLTKAGIFAAGSAPAVYGASTLTERER